MINDRQSLKHNIENAIEILKNDDVIAIPTETVYGLAGNIYSDKAIRKIFDLKKRPFYNPLIVHIHSINQLNSLASDVPLKAKILAENFWPGPLTLILKKQPNISNLITADKETVAIRIPNHSLTLELLNKLDFPLAAPSANPFGSISPTKAEHVERFFGSKLKMVLNGGSCEKGIESTIVGFENDKPIIYRLGSISIEEITKVIGEVSIKKESDNSPIAPGMLSRHYAPNTKTVLVDNISNCKEKYTTMKIGTISFSSCPDISPFHFKKVLSQNKDLSEAASNLYSALHELDLMNLDLIIAEKFPNEGLGKSINDRLERSTKSK